MNKLRFFFKQFLPEVRSEWDKVTKPSVVEVRNTTIVVVVTSFLFAAFLWGSDQLITVLYQGTMNLLQGP